MAGPDGIPKSPKSYSNVHLYTFILLEWTNYALWSYWLSRDHHSSKCSLFSIPFFNTWDLLSLSTLTNYYWPHRLISSPNLRVQEFFFLWEHLTAGELLLSVWHPFFLPDNRNTTLFWELPFHRMLNWPTIVFNPPEHTDL